MDFFVNLNLELLEGDGNILDGINVVFTPGHTPGGQSVAVDTPEGLAVITGFCCSLEKFSPTGRSRPKGWTLCHRVFIRMC
jgi:hypothetical protein